VRLLFVGELGAAGNAVPFLEAAAAARSGRVLRDEYRVSAPGRLLAVVCGVCRAQARGDEITPA
jgi:hypothetical protein